MSCAKDAPPPGLGLDDGANTKTRENDSAVYCETQAGTPRNQLDEKHRQELYDSGLADETIDRAGIYSAKDGQIRGLLDWKPKAHHWGNAMVIPFGDNGYARVKLDWPRHDNNGRAIKYESPRGAGNHAYFPPGFDSLLAESNKLVITEGEKKALSISQNGIACIGITGVWNWQEKRSRSDSGKPYGERKLIPDLQRIEWHRYTVIIVFDSDAAEKPSVQLAEARLAETLTSAGATVRAVRPPRVGEGKTGADDFIVARGAEAFRALLETATEVEMPPKPEPMDWARIYIDERHRISTGVTIRWHRDVFFVWNGTCYKPLPASELQGIILQFLDQRGDKARKHFANEVMTCIASEVAVSAAVDPPVYLGRDGQRHPNWLAFRNGILDLDQVIRGKEVALRKCTPLWFSQTALPYNYDPKAECPVWFATLDAIFDGDVECVALLSEFFGYALTEDTRWHAILLLEGPPRSGKGTILRTLRDVVGEDNTVSPRLSGLSELFGLWGLIGKRLAVCPDAHLGHGDKALATLETLKLISGEDAIEVHRKNLPSVTVRLRTRFVLAVNELPKFGDYSGALAPRVHLLPCRNSFAGREDTHLEEKLHGELPGIFRFALEGLTRLHGQGRFTKPAASATVEADFGRLVSPVRAFVEDQCDVRPDATCTRDEVWKAWKEWCETNESLPGTRETLGSRLRSMLPTLRDLRPRTDDGRVWMYQGIGLKE